MEHRLSDKSAFAGKIKHRLSEVADHLVNPVEISRNYFMWRVCMTKRDSVIFCVLLFLSFFLMLAWQEKKIIEIQEIQDCQKSEILGSVIHKTPMTIIRDGKKSLNISSNNFFLLLHYGTEAQDNKNLAVTITKRVCTFLCSALFLRRGFIHICLYVHCYQDSCCRSVSLRFKEFPMHEIYLGKIRCNQLYTTFDFVKEKGKKKNTREHSLSPAVYRWFDDERGRKKWLRSSIMYQIA